MTRDLRTISLARELEAPLASGHPWIYRDALPRQDLADGEWVRLVAGRAVGFGLHANEGAIGVRVFSSQGVPDRAWFEERADEALDLRRPIGQNGTDAYRLVHGEGDGLPAIVIDRYGRHGVAKLYSSSVREAAGSVVRAVASRLRLRGVSERSESGLEPLYGEAPPPEITVSENGLRLLVNPYEGQKTGLFLDQRDNRATVRSLSSNRSVLNLFSYNGGFSVAALAGGAQRVVSVDVAGAALRDSERSVALNGLEGSRHEIVQADVFDYLAAEGGAFDLVVCDPPSFAHSKSGRHAAMRAYRRLNSLAFSRVSSGGLLATSSCTAQVGPQEFRRVVAEAAGAAGVRAQIVHEAGHARDHPVPAHFPEGRYLKFLVLRVLPRP